MLLGCGGASTLSRGATSPRVGCMSSGQSATSQWRWGFHTVRGGINPGDLRFRPLFVGVVEIWKDFVSGDETLSSPGAAGPRRCPVGKLPPCTGSMSPSQSATSQSASQPVWLRFPYRAGRYGLGDLRFRPQVVGVVKMWKDF